MIKKLILSVLTPLAVLGLAGANVQKPASVQSGTVDFNRDVRPILARNCLICHGLDTGRRAAGLRLDTADGANRALPSGHTAITPGKPYQSELVKRISATGPFIMPPATSGKKLAPAQVALLRRWVAEGGKYATHWSYVPVHRPAVPQIRNPKSAIRNPVDRFLLARLAAEGITPTPEADRRALVRRLSLDLIGMPPTPAEVKSFLADRRSDAYEQLVDRLLSSPHFGERMAVYWLDLVRYADTVGYHGDQDVTVWPYRDFVIDAFNSNKPFDQFTREQLAGDLIPQATDAQCSGSAYNRLGMMSTEGGAQDKEYRAKYAADRVRNASGVWLGATLQCAECHDHKYDPYATKDFYRFAAFFADLEEKGFYDRGHSQGDWGPILRLPNPDQKAALANLDGEIADARKSLDSVPDPAIDASRAKWIQALVSRDPAKSATWTVAMPAGASSSGGSTIAIQPGGVVFISGKLPAFDDYEVTIPAGQGQIASIKFEALGDESLPGNGIARSGHYPVLSEFEVCVQRGNSPPHPVKLSSVVVTGQDEGFPGYAAIDGKPETGWAIVHAHTGARIAVFHLEEPLSGGPDVKLIVRLRHQTKPRLAFGKFRLLLSDLQSADLSANGVPDQVLAAAQKSPDQRNDAEKQALAAHYRKVAPELAEQRDRLARLEGERSILLGQIPQTLVSKAVAPRTMRVLPRGNWMDDSGEVVQPGAPHFLRQIAGSNRATRLDLADWLMSPDNPLTARVFVNRLWKLYFGTGLAKNLDDFGAQGEAPVHPELLDWLASEFMKPTMDGGRSTVDSQGRPAPNVGGESKSSIVHRPSSKPWDVKHIVRLMVTSAAYRRSSTATRALLARDPFNRLCARQSISRLDAEFVRDTALRVSGLLSERIGGPSVYPYEPRAYLASLNFPHREWAADAGESLYRRAIYTKWQRTFVHPSLLAFDAPSREECTCQRLVSNTPLQALVLLNDPIFVEAGRVFAERIIREGGATVDSRLCFAFEAALGRLAAPNEAAVLRKLLGAERARYNTDRAAAQGVIAAGDSPVAHDLDVAELAAWTAVARALLNLHETITRS